MRSLAAFLAGLAVALTAPAVASKVEVVCRPVVRPAIKCDPTSLRYNRAPPDCRIA